VKQFRKKGCIFINHGFKNEKKMGRVFFEVMLPVFLFDFVSNIKI